jgi:hypothetical protein
LPVFAFTWISNPFLIVLQSPAVDAAGLFYGFPVRQGKNLARSKKQEARSKKQETLRVARCKEVTFQTGAELS